MIGIQDQYFGTEIEMTGITRQRAAEVVAELFGTEAVHEGAYYGIWSARDREGKEDPETPRRPDSRLRMRLISSGLLKSSVCSIK